MDWRAALGTFLVVLISEVGDKTQLATMAVAAQSRSPLMVFLGAAAALVVSALMGVLFGDAVSRVLTPSALRRLAGVLFLVMGAMLVVRH